VGLGHVTSLKEIMYSGRIDQPPREATNWGPGDLRGLYYIGGNQVCIAEPPAPRS
jgi:hypothetical protein